MKTFVQRNYDRTEHDDFVLNVEKLLVNDLGAVPQYHEGQIVGWVIKPYRE